MPTRCASSSVPTSAASGALDTAGRRRAGRRRCAYAPGVADARGRGGPSGLADDWADVRAGAGHRRRRRQRRAPRHRQRALFALPRWWPTSPTPTSSERRSNGVRLAMLGETATRSMASPRCSRRLVARPAPPSSTPATRRRRASLSRRHRRRTRHHAELLRCRRRRLTTLAPVVDVRCERHRPPCSITPGAPAGARRSTSAPVSRRRRPRSASRSAAGRLLLRPLPGRGWVDEFYLAPAHHLTYRRLRLGHARCRHRSMYAHVALLAALGVAIAVGYRTAARRRRCSPSASPTSS